MILIWYFHKIHLLQKIQQFHELCAYDRTQKAAKLCKLVDFFQAKVLPPLNIYEQTNCTKLCFTKCLPKIVYIAYVLRNQTFMNKHYVCTRLHIFSPSAATFMNLLMLFSKKFSFKSFVF